MNRFRYHLATSAQQAAAKQLGVIPNTGNSQTEYIQSTYSNDFCLSGRASPISLNGQHLGAIGSQHRTMSPQQQMFVQLESQIGAASAPNSTRGSSPTAPINVGSQSSLHNPTYQYKTWSNSSMASSINENLAADKFKISLNQLIGMFSENCGMSMGMNSGQSSCDEGLGMILTFMPYHFCYRRKPL
jgi:hypothetical protein